MQAVEGPLISGLAGMVWMIACLLLVVVVVEESAQKVGPVAD
jgi:hypothetical protein